MSAVWRGGAPRSAAPGSKLLVKTSHVRRLSPLLLAGLIACNDSGSITGTDGPETPVPTTVSMSAPTVGLTWLGETHQLTATVRDQSGQVMGNPSLVWMSANPEVATVSTTGLVTAVAEGSTEITVTVAHLGATVSVTVLQTPLSVTLSPGTAVLYGPHDTVRIAAVVLDEGGTEIPRAELLWSTTDKAVATVSAEGLVTAASPGQVTVMAETTGFDGSASGQSMVTVHEALRIVTADLASGVMDAEYQETLEATGGEGAYAWEVVDGALPAGLTLDPSTGSISGTPTSTGSRDFSVQVSSGVRSVSRAFTIDVYARLSITTTSLPDGQEGQAYSASVFRAGGNGPFAWTVSQGALHAGLSLDPATGAITGRPSVVGDRAFTVQVSSDDGQVATRGLALRITETPPAASGLMWPVPGWYGTDWVINNYVDLDPGAGIRDYLGGSKSYNGHNGIDIDVPNFRWMDNGFPVIAAAPGRVTRVHDGEPDRNTSCVGAPNVVEILHADGSSARYLHLKRNSATVTVGQQVAAGARLGVVGSSGCSTQPHLHFELRDAGNGVIDPFKDGLWEANPSYSPPLAFMDAVLKNGAITHVDQLKDPDQNITAIAVGDTLGVGLSMAGGGAGDQIRVTIEGGSGAQVYELGRTFDRPYRHTYWYWNRIVTADTGTWKIRIYTNGQLKATYYLTVS